MRLALALSLLAACGDATQPPAPEGHAALPATPAPAGDSLYLLELHLRDQAGQDVRIDLHRGHPVLVAMFYATCPMACPTLIQDLRRLEQDLTPEARADLRVLLVSLDPETDDQGKLQEVATRHALDLSRWTLAAPRPDEVRDLAAVLGIAYRRLEDGELNHSSLITLLDAEGRPVARLEGLRQDPAPLLDRLRLL